MPKGGLLHAHLDAMVRSDILLRIALKQPALHVRISDPLSAKSLKCILPEFRALPRSRWTENTSLTGSEYVTSSWVPIQNARNNFDPALGGPEGFDRWVIGSLMIDPSEAYGTHNTTDRVGGWSCDRVCLQTDPCHL